MTSLKSLSIVCLVASLLFAGCKKKESTADQASATKSAEPAGAAAAPSAAISSDDDYASQASKMLDKMIETIKGAGTNCDKLADEITKLASDNGAQMKTLEAYEKSHPDAKKKFEAGSKDKMKAFEEAAGPAMGACASNKKVSDAFEKLAPG